MTDCIRPKVSRLFNDMDQMHAIQDGLDTASNDLNHVLEDPSGQINLVASVDIVDELVVNLAHLGMLRPYGSKK